LTSRPSAAWRRRVRGPGAAAWPGAGRPCSASGPARPLPLAHPSPAPSAAPHPHLSRHLIRRPLCANPQAPRTASSPTWRSTPRCALRTRPSWPRRRRLPGSWCTTTWRPPPASLRSTSWPRCPTSGTTRRGRAGARARRRRRQLPRRRRGARTRAAPGGG
jgi:hypothetical protein